MKRCFATGIVVALGFSAAASADLDWAVISTSGSPDPITAFDLASPGASNTGLGVVDGNFNRGMDFDSYNSFYYYVSTDSLNDPGDRGLWYWNNGVNTQLFNTPFSDSRDGDATLSSDLSHFYVSTEDEDGFSGMSIYAFDDLNGTPTYTEIGETGLTQLIGLAVNPATGVMYGYDSATEALYTIDTTDGTPTLVGLSGLSLNAIGGMDFSADGSTLLLADGNDGLYTIDTTDGSFTFAGSLGSLNVGALSHRVVPSPGVLALLGLAGLAGRRRRR